MIEIKGLLKKLDDYVVLSDLNLKVKRGSIYGLIGSNGAGKSTLLNILSGVYKADEGNVKINGREVYENNILKDKTAFITDDPFYFNSSTVDEMAHFLSKVYSKFDMEKYREISSMFPIDTSKRINTFSKGMRRQVSIILALSQNPEILLCDESFDGLDPVIRQMVKRLFVSEVAERDMTIIISSHNLREMENLCDTVGILHENKIVVEKSISDIKDAIHRYQVAFKPMIDVSLIEAKLQVVTKNIRGNILELIVRGNEQEINNTLEGFNPLLVDKMELSLEDIFICEMEVSGYDFSKILL